MCFPSSPTDVQRAFPPLDLSLNNSKHGSHMWFTHCGRLASCTQLGTADLQLQACLCPRNSLTRLGFKHLDPCSGQPHMEKVKDQRGRALRSYLHTSLASVTCKWQCAPNSGWRSWSTINRLFSWSRWFWIQFSRWSFLHLHPQRRHGLLQSYNCCRLPC